MRIPTSRVEKTIRQLVRLNSVTYTITRPNAGPTDTSKAAMGESLPTSATHNEDIWLFAPSENPIDTEFGDRLTANLMGLALPSANIQENDEITYEGFDYVVLEATEAKEEDPAVTDVVTMIALTRKINTNQAS